MSSKIRCNGEAWDLATVALSFVLDNYSIMDYNQKIRLAD